MSFLETLGDAIAGQFNLGENNTTTLDSLNDDGVPVKYGSLGDFASQFDQSAERRYVEEGYLRRDPYNTDPKQLETLWQEPNATVLVKKRMFSSIAENFRPDFMDRDEKIYYKAMNVLFQNKCAQIAALEQLGKISQVTAAVGNINEQLLPIIITLADIANNGFGSGGNLFGANIGSNSATTQNGSSFFKTVDRLRTLQAFNKPAKYTTWLTDSTNLFKSTFGTGTGVIEITNFTNLSTNTSVDIRNQGSFTINISDPYEAMLITEYDIEVALSDATNLFYNSKAFDFGKTSANKVIADQQNQLNNIRKGRNASPITFKIDPNTLLSKRITVIIDRIGVSIPFTYNPLGGLIGLNSAVKVPDDYLRGGAVAGYDGLDKANSHLGPDNNIRRLISNSELTIFTSIITTIYQQLALMANSANGFTANNQSFNYARRKLRFNFAGKLIIQPLDVVNIYFNSKSQYDNKILSGLQQMFSGFGILQNITTTLNSLTNAADTLFNPSGNISVQAEKSMYVGPDFPNYLWATMRNQFITENEGTHVFGGVVESASDSWSNGAFNISVTGKDNTFYWDQGKINFKPGADAFNGLIFDPLTPFKSSFDSITNNNIPAVTNTPELLEENKYLLSQTGKDSLVKYKLGAMAGEKATQGNYLQDQNFDKISGRLTRVFYAPDGLAYKWKQGIGVFTQTGTGATINGPSLVGHPNIYAEPFAGLDVMNVLSLLVTGIPYNFATYFKSTSDLNGFTGDPQSKQSSTHTYIDSLKTDLSKNNSLWGNFVPFKNLSMNSAAIAEAMKAQLTVSNANQDLDSKIRELNDVQNSLTGFGAINALSKSIKGQNDPSVDAQVSKLQAKATEIQKSIDNSVSQVQSATTQFYSQINTTGSYDSNQLIDGKNNPSNDDARKLLRKQTNYLTRRMSYDVRANDDRNLFIVDDYYDIDYDIAAFNKALSDGIKLYSTEFTSVKEKIMNVADLLDLEVFCDSQGHIRVRPPQYNRMPSSVFYRMLYLKQTLGVQIFPQFLNNLFTNQLDSLRNRIEILEDLIRLDCAILGHYPSLDVNGDVDATIFLVLANSSGGMGGSFTFISNSSGKITDVKNLIQQANQEEALGEVGQGTDDYDKIVNSGISTKQFFGNAERYTVLLQALQAQQLKQSGTNTNNSPTTSVFQNSVVQTLINRVNTKSGQFITSKDYLVQANPNQPREIDTGQTIDFFKVTSEITTYINEWQTAVKAFYHTIKNAAEYQSLDDDSTTGNALQNPGLFHNAYVPEVYEHMIEDEQYDDYGPGSGSRYIIKGSQIRSLNLQENAPSWTSVEVQGTSSPYFSEKSGGGGPEGFGTFPGGGNGMVTAIAIDYDMWRNYGFKQQHTIQVPFLSDPDTQLGPYAAMVLTRNRANVLRGTCTISGNEYMQPGEVIFLKDRNLLFYVNSVKHSFGAGREFTTTLELTYGHTIGDYIPTYLDTVGKLLYKNQATANLIIQRQDSSSQEQALGVIQLDGKNPTVVPLNTGSENQQTSSFYAANTKIVQNILYNTAYVINANGSSGNNIKADIELRLYYDAKLGVSSEVYGLASKVKDALTGVSQGPMNSPTANQPVKNYSLPADSVKIVVINVDEAKDRRSPSQKAIDAARNQMVNVSTNSGSPTPSNPTGNDDGTDAVAMAANNNALRTALFSYIVDCWISFSQVPSTQSSGNSADPGY